MSSQRDLPYRLVAIDLDDSLLQDDLVISEQTKETIQLVRQAGVTVTIATGRMFQSARPYAQELGLDLPLITYQGALIRNALSGENLLHRPVPQRLSREILSLARQRQLHLNVYVDDQLYMDRLTPEGTGYARLAGIEPIVTDLAEILTEEPTKMLLISDEDRLDQLQREIGPQYQDQLHITKSKPNFLELMHPQATKGTAIAFLAEKLGIGREQVMAIGDSFNDLEMLQYAGCGVVMGNARPEVKAHADFITASNQEDGVAKALDQLILQQIS